MIKEVTNISLWPPHVLCTILHSCAPPCIDVYYLHIKKKVLSQCVKEGKTQKISLYLLMGTKPKQNTGMLEEADGVSDPQREEG